ncbi:MAG: hypothetical protein ACK58T_20530, partial [Phycisphaerae bacterium]
EKSAAKSRTGRSVGQLQLASESSLDAGPKTRTFRSPRMAGMSTNTEGYRPDNETERNPAGRLFDVVRDAR